MNLSHLLTLNKAIDNVGRRIGRDLALRQLHILGVVVAAGESGIDATKLGEVTETSSSAVSRNVRILGAVHYDKHSPGLGLVKVELDPMDNRRRVIKATKDGIEVIRAFVASLYKGD